MSDPIATRKLERARRLIASSSWDGAIAALREVLAEDPDDGDAHAMLASVLYEQRRLHAARHEAEVAVGLAPESAFAHRVLGTVSIGARRFDDADRHLSAALNLDPSDTGAHLALAVLARARGDRAGARSWLERGLALDPTDPEILAELALHLCDEGDLDGAERYAREALEEHAGATNALVAMGHVKLRRGALDEALEHAHWALRQDPADRGTVALLVSIKARQSLALGLWWRWATLTGNLGDGRSIALVLAMFVGYRVLSLVLGDLGMEGAASLLQIAWLALCAYTWFAPAVFRRMLERELEVVRLRDDY